MWFCPQDGVDVVLRTVITVLTGPGRSAAAVLVKEVGQAHGGHQGGGQAKAAMEHDLDLILIRAFKFFFLCIDMHIKIDSD